MIGSETELSAQFVIEVSVRDIQRSLAYYTDLGFSVTRQANGFATHSVFPTHGRDPTP